MGGLIGPKCRRCRREGMKLYLKGDRCDSPKCAYSRRDYPPGMHPFRRGKVSDYALQLREKQKAKRYYGIRERQFQKCFREAERLPGNTGQTLLVMLERRLDNVLTRAGFAASRTEARQIVGHGHVTVNGRKVDIASYLCGEGQVIGIVDRKNNRTRIKERMDRARGGQKPGWLQIDPKSLQVKVLALPTRDEVSLPVQEQLIVELCSR
ncbi:MAG: 30S ribosomal protein S4 [Planctomycetota bacterium]